MIYYIKGNSALPYLWKDKIKIKNINNPVPRSLPFQHLIFPPPFQPPPPPQQVQDSTIWSLTSKNEGLINCKIV